MNENPFCCDDCQHTKTHYAIFDRLYPDMVNELDVVDVDKAAMYIASCQNFDLDVHRVLNHMLDNIDMHWCIVD